MAQEQQWQQWAAANSLKNQVWQSDHLNGAIVKDVQA
jgi:hypothetical protein